MRPRGSGLPGSLRGPPVHAFVPGSCRVDADNFGAHSCRGGRLCGAQSRAGSGPKLGASSAGCTHLPRRGGPQYSVSGDPRSSRAPEGSRALWDDRDGGRDGTSIPDQPGSAAFRGLEPSPPDEPSRACGHTAARCGAHEVMTPESGRARWGARSWACVKGLVFLAPAPGMWDLGLRSKSVVLQALNRILLSPSELPL